MAAIKFERTGTPVGAVTFTRNPSVADKGDQGQTGYLQPRDRADGGDLYCTDKGLARDKIRTLHFGNNPDADWTNFQAFLDTIRGLSYPFLFTDSDGSLYWVYLWNADSLPYGRVTTGRMWFTVELFIVPLYIFCSNNFYCGSAFYCGEQIS